MSTTTIPIKIDIDIDIDIDIMFWVLIIIELSDQHVYYYEYKRLSQAVTRMFCIKKRSFDKLIKNQQWLSVLFLSASIFF